LEKIPSFEVLVVRSATKVTKDVISAGKNLKIVARAGMGLDNVDVGAAKENGITVLNAPEAPTVAVAELVLGMMLAWVRHIPKADSTMKGGLWEKSKLKGSELRGKTLGVVGIGRIGQAVAHRARAFGMKILVYDVVQNEEFLKAVEGEFVGLDDLLKRSDFVTLHIPLTPETKHMMGKEKLELMKPTAVLVNTSRGAVVDETALIEFLREGRIAGACIDVYEREPPGDTPLSKLPNAILTPHIGASTEEAQRKAALIVAEKIKKSLSK
jgi:D-3-phosphoglycerate dehydrogenase